MNAKQNTMKRSLLVAMVLLCLPAMVSAQVRWRKKRDMHDDYHFVYASVGAGYSSLTAPKTMGTIRGDYGALVGLGYEFRHGGFWLSVGGQLQEQNSRIELEPFTLGTFDATDPDHQILGEYSSKDVYLRYNIRQTDVNRWHSGDIPIMAGYYLHGFYIGAGLKTGFAFRNSICATGDYDYNLKFVRYVDDPYTEDINFKGILDTRKQVDFRTQVHVIGEVGYDILSIIPTRSLYCHVLKVGFYWEVGVNSIQKDNITYEEHYTKHKDCSIQVNPYMTSKLNRQEFVAPFFTGVKVTYMFGGSRTGSHGVLHTGCQCYNN